MRVLRTVRGSSRLALAGLAALALACGGDSLEDDFQGAPAGLASTASATAAGTRDAGASATPTAAAAESTPNPALPEWVQTVIASPPTPVAGGGGSATSPRPPASTQAAAPPAPAPPPATGQGGGVRRITLANAFGGRVFNSPVELGAYPGGRFFIAEQDGPVLLVTADGRDAGTLLNLSGRVTTQNNEEGLLSVQLAPGFPSPPHLYAYYAAAGPRRTVLSRFTVSGDGAGSEQVLLEVSQPYGNHKGGAIRFGPDGMLYLGLGDGGSGGDPHGNGQNLGTHLGKILRLDVSGGGAYAVPGDNPFVSTPGALPEIWAYGLRNPWRMAFDPATGALWAGDVGQGAVEEIDVIRRGANYGWNRFEGSRCNGGACDRSGLTFPVAEYGHDLGCSVTGGVVYRGSAIPQLVGHYLYSDYCGGRVWALPTQGGAPVLVADRGNRPVASFGTDAAGEVYLVVHNAPILRITGAE